MKVKIQDISVSGSRIKNIWVRKNSEVGDIKIQSNSKAENVQVLENSTTGDFRIERSSIGNFDIRQKSTIQRFSLLENSTMGDFKIVDSSATIITIQGRSKLAKLRVWHSMLQRIEIKSNSFISHFKCQFNLHTPAHLVLEQSSFGHLNFNNSVYPEFTTLKISDCKTNRLT
ncbi:MAG: hypothetical protein IPJ82_03775 [Lewinellaceae bacterium]|nr:hypothetical protein [Lewinellaceae bacterium]